MESERLRSKIRQIPGVTRLWNEIRRFPVAIKYVTLYLFDTPRDIQFAKVFNEYFSKEDKQNELGRLIHNKKSESNNAFVLFRKRRYKVNDSEKEEYLDLGIPHCQFYFEQVKGYNDMYLKVPHECYCFYESRCEKENMKCEKEEECNSIEPNKLIIKALEKYNRDLIDIGFGVHRVCHNPNQAIYDRIIDKLKPNPNINEKEKDIERCRKHYFEVMNMRQTWFQLISGYGAKATAWLSTLFIYIAVLVSLWVYFRDEMFTGFVMGVAFLVGLVGLFIIWRLLTNWLLQQTAKDCLFLCLGMDYDKPKRSYDAEEKEKDIERYVIYREKEKGGVTPIVNH